MYDENDYVMKQIKSMVRGLGKFMGLEQIKDLLQIDIDEQGDMTDLELETIIAIAKLEVILANNDTSIDELSDDVLIDPEHLNLLMKYEVPATQEELDQLTNYLEANQSL